MGLMPVGVLLLSRLLASVACCLPPTVGLVRTRLFKCCWFDCCLLERCLRSTDGLRLARHLALPILRVPSADAYSKNNWSMRCHRRWWRLPPSTQCSPLATESPTRPVPWCGNWPGWPAYLSSLTGKRWRMPGLEWLQVPHNPLIPCGTRCCKLSAFGASYSIHGPCWLSVRCAPRKCPSTLSRQLLLPESSSWNSYNGSVALPLHDQQQKARSHVSRLRHPNDAIAASLSAQPGGTFCD